MLLHIRIENGIAVSLAQRAKELKLIAAAEIGICKAMEKARARLIAGERIVAGGYRHIFRIFCDTSERSRSAIDILCGHLARCCPRLIAVDKEFFVLFILMPEFERRRNERYRARGNESQLHSALIVNGNDREVRSRIADGLIDCAGERIFESEYGLVHPVSSLRFSLQAPVYHFETKKTIGI